MDWKNWKIPLVGDYMFTPMGITKVTHVTQYTWSGYCYVNIPFWEGGNWNVFRVLNKEEIEKHVK